jgi:hypothetical protein
MGGFLQGTKLVLLSLLGERGRYVMQRVLITNLSSSLE